jgi:hypothetical protein
MEGLLEEDNLPTPDDERELVERTAADAFEAHDAFLRRMVEEDGLVREPRFWNHIAPLERESWKAAARAAIAVVLEEAAKVADNHNAFSLSGDPWKYPTEIAAAIRAINPKER